MSKKLWQAIGLETHPTDVLEYPSINNSNRSHPSTIHQFDISHPSQARNEHTEFSGILEASHRYNTSIEHDKDLMSKYQQDENSIEIESCESQPLDSDESSEKIFTNKRKTQKSTTSKKKIQEVSHSLSELREEFQTFNEWIRDQMKLKTGEVQDLAVGMYNKLCQEQQQKLELSKKCTKCETTKLIIDSLTKQCWQAESKYNQKVIQNRKLNKQLSKNLERQDSSMKKIQTCLMQQRGEIIKKLKKEIEQLKEENISLCFQLEGKSSEMTNIQNKYKNSLTIFKEEIQSINQTCCRKIEMVMGEKIDLENQYHLSQERYRDLEETFEQQKIDRAVKKRYNTSQQERLLEFSLSNKELEGSFIKNKSIIASQKVYKGNHNLLKPKVSSSFLDMELNQSIQIYPQSATSQVKRENTERHTVYWQNNPSTLSPIGKGAKSDLISTTIAKNSDIKATHSMQRINTAESSFELALSKLSQIQKGVRQQIKRSKKSYK